MYSARPFYTDGGALAPGSFDGDLEKGDPDSGSAMGTPLEGGAQGALCQCASHISGMPLSYRLMPPGSMNAVATNAAVAAWHRCAEVLRSARQLQGRLPCFLYAAQTMGLWQC